MSNKIEIASRLRQARELAGLSQSQAAKRLDLHRPTVSEIEAGRRNVRPEELVEFSKLYSVELNWITTGKVMGQEKVDQSILAAARELSSMSDKDIETLMNTIRIIRGSGDENGKN